MTTPKFEIVKTTFTGRQRRQGGFFPVVRYTYELDIKAGDVSGKIQWSVGSGWIESWLKGLPESEREEMFNRAQRQANVDMATTASDYLAWKNRNTLFSVKINDALAHWYKESDASGVLYALVSDAEICEEPSGKTCMRWQTALKM